VSFPTRRNVKVYSDILVRIYTASLSSILPLPMASVPPNDPSHLSAYPEYRSGTIVLALYPETTSFYKAEVVASPKEMMVPGARVSLGRRLVLFESTHSCVDGSYNNKGRSLL